MLESVATELLRDPLDLPPWRVPSDCGARAGKLLQVPGRKEAARREPPQWPEVEQEAKTWIRAQRQPGISVSTKGTQESKRIA